MSSVLIPEPILSLISVGNETTTEQEGFGFCLVLCFKRTFEVVALRVLGFVQEFWHRLYPFLYEQLFQLVRTGRTGKSVETVNLMVLD